MIYIVALGIVAALVVVVLWRRRRRPRAFDIPSFEIVRALRRRAVEEERKRK